MVEPEVVKVVDLSVVKMVDPDLYVIVAIASPLCTFVFFWFLELWKGAVIKKAFDIKMLRSVMWELKRNLNSAKAAMHVNDAEGSGALSELPVCLNFEDVFWRKFLGELPLRENDLEKMVSAYATLNTAKYMQEIHKNAFVPNLNEQQLKEYNNHLKTECDRVISDWLPSEVVPSLNSAMGVLALKIKSLEKVGVWDYIIANFKRQKYVSMPELAEPLDMYKV